MKEFTGEHRIEGGKIAIVISRTNPIVTERLLEGAMDVLLRHGADEALIEVIRVPGTFEVPAGVTLASRRDYGMIVALGAVIRGGTSHAEFIAAAVSRGLAEISRTASIPIGFGILTAETMDQALERAGGKMGNRGEDAALAAMEMMNLGKALDG